MKLQLEFLSHGMKLGERKDSRKLGQIDFRCRDIVKVTTEVSVYLVLYDEGLIFFGEYRFHESLLSHHELLKSELAASMSHKDLEAAKIISRVDHYSVDTTSEG